MLFINAYRFYERTYLIPIIEKIGGKEVLILYKTNKSFFAQASVEYTGKPHYFYISPNYNDFIDNNKIGQLTHIVKEFFDKSFIECKYFDTNPNGQEWLKSNNNDFKVLYHNPGEIDEHPSCIILSLRRIEKEKICDYNYYYYCLSDREYSISSKVEFEVGGIRMIGLVDLCKSYEKDAEIPCKFESIKGRYAKPYIESAEMNKVNKYGLTNEEVKKALKNVHHSDEIDEALLDYAQNKDDNWY